MQRDFFRGAFLDVVRGRLDLYVALHDYFEPKGLADRIEEFVAYWFEKDCLIDHELLAQAAAWRRRTGGALFCCLEPGASPGRLAA